jgi:hypothetical protein
VCTMTRSIESQLFLLIFSKFVEAIWTICVRDVLVWPGQGQDRAQH